MKVKLYDHPFADCGPKEFDAPNLGEWLLAWYGEVPRTNVSVFVGEPSAETDITGDVAAILRSDAPVYTVIESPGDPVSILVNIAISMALNAIATALFAPKRQQQNRSQESPNNQLADRQNRVRMLERVEDIYGTVRSTPSLMMPTYSKWINNDRVEYGYYCIGRGYYEVPTADVRDSTTPLTSITGACAAIYPPFTSPNSGSPQATIGDAIIDKLLMVSRIGSVDGIILKPANQLQLAPNQDYRYVGARAGETRDQIYQPTPTPSFAAVSEVGQTITISHPNRVVQRTAASVTTGTNTYTATAGFFKMAVVGGTVTVTGFADANDGVKTVASVSSNGAVLTVTDTLITGSTVANITFGLTVNYSGTRVIAEVKDDYSGLFGRHQTYYTLAGPSIYPTHATTPISGSTFYGDEIVSTITVANGMTDWTDWHTLRDSDRTEVWTNVVAMTGMYRDDGAKSSTSVAYEVQIERLTPLFAPTGVVETITGTVSGATSNERGETLEQVTAWTGPARVRARRTTPFDYEFGGLVNDEIRLADLFSVTPVTQPHFGNKTTIHTIRRSTQRAAAIRSPELNCLVSRRLPTYNGSTWSGAFNSEGRHVSGTISPTSRIVDIIAAVAQDPKIGRRVLADDIDIPQIWSVQQALNAWNPACGQFNYTFDTDAISFEETVNTIANAAFCAAYRQNGKVRLALDRPQSSSVALFTHRNKALSTPSEPKEFITRKFASDSDYDGVELTYADPDTESPETIRLPLDGSYTKLKKIEIPGIRSYPQAWLRANRELARIKNQRLTIETDVTLDARRLLPNSRIDIVDNTRFKSYDGEVVGQSGLVLTLSRDVVFASSTPHSIILMKRDGSTQSIACTAVAGYPNRVLLASAPAEAIVTEPSPEEGIRTIFSFAADSARGAMAWLVQELRPKGQYIQIAAINYSSAYYTADSQPIPDKSGVIYD